MKNLTILTLFFALVFAQRFPQKKQVLKQEELSFQLIYSGSFNGEALQGTGQLKINTKTGQYSSNIKFSQLPKNFEPKKLASLLIGPCCGFGAKVNSPGAYNFNKMIWSDFSNAQELKVFQMQKLFATLTIHTKIQRSSANRLKAYIHINGNSQGALTSLVVENGYTKGLTFPSKNKTYGSFEITKLISKVRLLSKMEKQQGGIKVQYQQMDYLTDPLVHNPNAKIKTSGTSFDESILFFENPLVAFDVPLIFKPKPFAQIKITVTQNNWDIKSRSLNVSGKSDLGTVIPLLRR